MMVANSFDLWQKDAFFSAAEEVQESADIMESAYRTWVRERREGLTHEDLDELYRELKTALGTAKWQVGKQPPQWVNLDQEERDDLALFLSGTSGTLQNAKEEHVELGHSMKGSPRENHYKRKETDFNLNAACNRDMPDEIKDRTTGTRRTGNSPPGSWKIVIADEDEHSKKLVPSIEATPKGKGSKAVLWKQRWGEHPQAKRGINWFSQIFGRVGGLQRQLQSPLQLQFSCSVQLTIALMLTIFLIGRLLTCFIMSSNGSALGAEIKGQGSWIRDGHGSSAFCTLFKLRLKWLLLLGIRIIKKALLDIKSCLFTGVKAVLKSRKIFSEFPGSTSWVNRPKVKEYYRQQ
ncbi:hypothetical protein CK203_106186 [Vitis vinifera]|uniref:Syntaxin 6/10/61 N-terminal domain-containing protein n=1 Tax=Vitis vinifera TaxID=29760 RepID=A0A438CXT2_VITVI|nr:hypothetical protein CK203_106186 [Vitis vinifera]